MTESVNITVRELNRGLEVTYLYTNLTADQIDRLVLTLTDQSVENDEKTITFSENDGLEKDGNTFVINNLTVGSEYSIRLFAILDNSDNILESDLVTKKILDLVEPDVEAKGVTEAILVQFNNLVAFGEQCNTLGETGRVELYGTEFKKTGGVERIFNAGKIDISNTDVPTEFRITGLKNLVRYEINVSYINSLGRKSVTQSATPSKLLEAPQNVSLNMVESSEREAFLLQWNAPANVADGEYDKAAYYWIYRSTSENFDVSDNNRIHILDTSGVTDLSYVDADPSLNHGTKYYYRISGVRNRDNSSQPEEPDVNDRNPSDNLIEGVASQEIEGYFFKHIDVRTEKPSVTYSPLVNNQLVDISLANPASTTLYDASAQQYEIAYDLSYSVIKHDESVDVSRSGVYRFTLNDDTLDDVLQHIQSELDLSMNYGETLEFELRMVQIYRSDEFVSLYSDKQLATAHSTPQAPINLRYAPDRDNDKQFHLSWDDIHYDADVNSNVSPYDSYIKYKVFSVSTVENVETETELTDLETSGNSVLVREQDLTMDYNETYKFKVKAVLYENVENTEQGNKHGKTAEDLESVLSEELEVLIFEHVDVSQVTVTHAIEQDNKNVDVKLRHPLTYVSTHQVGTEELYSSYYDISHSKAVEESESIVEASYNVVSVEQDRQLATLVHGNELSYQVQLVQLYRGYEFRNEISTVRSVTTHSTPVTPKGIHISPTTFDNQEPLSDSRTNGKLRVSWYTSPVQYYDFVGTTPGKYSNSIKYRIIDNSGNTLKENIELNRGNNTFYYNGLSANPNISNERMYADIDNLTLGQEYNLRVQAYYMNTETYDHSDNVVNEVTSGNSVNESFLEKVLKSDSSPELIYHETNGFVFHRTIDNKERWNKMNLYVFADDSMASNSNWDYREHISVNSSSNGITVGDLSYIEVTNKITNEYGANGRFWITVYTKPTNTTQWNGTRFNYTNNFIYSNISNGVVVESISKIDLNPENAVKVSKIPGTDASDQEILAIAISTDSSDGPEDYEIIIKDVNLVLNDGRTKTVSYTNNSLNRFDSAIYNEKFNVPFYYPDSVSGLEVNKNNVQPVGIARHTLPLEWDALTNDQARGTTGDNIVYDINVVSLDNNSINTTHEIVGQLTNTYTFDSMTLDNLYQINVRSIVRYNGVDMHLNTTDNIHFLKGSALRGLESTPSNNTLNVKWIRSLYGVTNDKASFVRYQYKLLNQDESPKDSENITDRNTVEVESTTLDNGTEYKVEVKSIYQYKGETFDSFVSILQDITTTPFFRPLVQNPELKERSDLSGSILTFTLDNNGRPLREYVLVYVPADEGDLFNQDIILEKASKTDEEYLNNEKNDASWNEHVVEKFGMTDNVNGNNTITDITIRTGEDNQNVKYKTKSVLLVFENEAGSKVVTVLEAVV